MMGFIKRAAEHTPLASVYRAARDEWRFCHQRPVQTPFGYRFVGPSTMKMGTFEAEERAEIERLLASAEVFVDVGANVGYFTCLACSMGKRVIAVEPLANNLRYLYANLEANGWADRAEIYPVGLASKPGLGKLYGAGTAASLLCGWAGASPSFQRTIPLSTLDILLGERFCGRRVVVKMDIEGCEYHALQGGARVLGMTPRPAWLVEITLSKHRQGALNPHFVDTFEIFWAHGYKATAIGHREREICQRDVREYADTTIQPAWVNENYLFTAESD